MQPFFDFERGVIDFADGSPRMHIHFPPVGAGLALPLENLLSKQFSSFPSEEEIHDAFLFECKTSLLLDSREYLSLSLSPPICAQGF